MSDVSDRDKLARILNRTVGGAFDLSMDAVTGAQILRMAADAILAEFLPEYTDEVRREAFKRGAAWQAEQPCMHNKNSAPWKRVREQNAEIERLRTELAEAVRGRMQT